MLSLCAVLYAFGQSGSQEKNLFQHYSSAEDFFQTGNYDVCYRSIETILSLFPDLPENLAENIHYMRACSAYELNRMESSTLLQDFLHAYPQSVHSSRLYLLLGTDAMNAEQYRDAMRLFSQSRSKDLSPKDKEDLCFRSAYVYIQLDSIEKAKTLLHALPKEGRYIGPSTYYKAYIAYKENRTKEAMEGFRKISALPEYERSVPFFIMQLHFKEGHYDQLLTMAESLLQKDPNKSERVELYRISAAAYYEKEDYSSSMELYEKYLSYQPELLRSDAYRIGMNYFFHQKYDLALSYLTKTTEEDDALTQNAIFHIGLCYLQQQKHDMARMSFERASLTDHDMAVKESALYNYALLCYQTSFSPFNEQVRAFERILSEFPQSKYADQIYSCLTDAFLSTKNYQASIEVLNKITNPNQELLKTKTTLLFLLGVEQFNNNDYLKALDLFNESVSLAGKIKIPATESFYWRAENLYRLNRLQEAKKDYQAFLNAKNASDFKAYPLAHYHLAYCFFNLKDYQSALYWFDKYLRLKSSEQEVLYTDVLNRIGDCHYCTKNYQKAEEFYSATDQNSQNGNDYASYQQAFCLGLRKQYKEKIKILSSFEQRFPQSDYLDNALFEEGRAYIALRQPDEAIKVFTHLMQTFPNNVLARKAGIQVGLLYYNENQPQKAIAAYQKIIEHYPGSEEAQTAFNDLKVIYVALNKVQEFVQYAENSGNGMFLQAGEQDSLSYLAAERQMMDNNKEEAINGFKKYIDQFPKGMFRTEAYFHAANLLLPEGDEKTAIPYLEEVVKNTGHRFVPQAIQKLAQYFYQKEDYAKALDYYRQSEPYAENRESRIQIRTSIMRCLNALGQTENLLQAAKTLLDEKNLAPELSREARYRKALSLLALNRGKEAIDDLTLLGKEPQTAFGAEARFRLAEYRYQQNDLDAAEKLVQDFLREGSSQSYWLARCFLLLSDIYVQRNDNFQAKQYLLSLKENYDMHDDIDDEITKRLNAIAQRSNE